MKFRSFNTNIFSKKPAFDGGTNLRLSGGTSSFLFWRRPPTLAIPEKWTPNRWLRRYTFTRTPLECPSPLGITMECNFFYNWRSNLTTFLWYKNLHFSSFHLFMRRRGKPTGFSGGRRRGDRLLLITHRGMYRPNGYKFWGFSVWKRV